MHLRPKWFIILTIETIDLQSYGCNIKNISFKKSLLISSTRVYQDSEEPINELSNINSEDFRAKSLLESEAIYSNEINSGQIFKTLIV